MLYILQFREAEIVVKLCDDFDLDEWQNKLLTTYLINFNLLIIIITITVQHQFYKKKTKCLLVIK